MLIGITGQKFSGKSTVANMLSEMLDYSIVSFADKLKDVTCALSGCTREQLEDYDFKENQLVPTYMQPYCGNADKPTYRAFLQHFGSEVMRGINDNIWIDSTLLNCGSEAIISDCRFPNEAKAIRNAGGIIIKIVRDNLVNQDSHQSETQIDNIEYDYIIYNTSSIYKLTEQVEQIVRKLIANNKV